MAARSYVPELRRILIRLNKYLATYTQLMLPHLNDAQAAALLALNLALQELITQLGPAPVGP